MAQDVTKQLERARHSLERNKLREAVTEYQAVLAEAPANQEALQALADIYTRLNEPALAAPYYGLQFDRLVEAGDSAKAAAIFSRFLRPFPQPPDRVMHYASLLRKQNRPAEAIEQFSAAAEIFLQQGREIEALACRESIAVLDPENPARHIALGELAESLHHADLAARSYLRAGQIALASGGLPEALEHFERAHRLAPEDRAAALIFAEAKLQQGDAAGAVALLDGFTVSEKDTDFLALFGDALLLAGQLDRAREVLEIYCRQKPDSFPKLFDLAAAYVHVGEDPKVVPLLQQTQEWMRAARKEAALMDQMDALAAACPASLPLAEEVARFYEELNRETKYFEALMRLFDLYFAAGKIKEACDSLDRLVDIDPYDHRIQERIARLKGQADPAFLQNILSRAAKAVSGSAHAGAFSGAGSDPDSPGATIVEELRAEQTLEDLLVQVEIFLQYSLQAKAVERLQQIAQLFPAEIDTNERLRALFERANWWPENATRTPTAAPPPSPAHARPESAPAADHAASATVPSAAETHRDLAAIAEINRLMYRQSAPREVLAMVASQIGKHLGVSRCLVAVGNAGEGAQLTAEFFAPDLQPAGTPRIRSLAEMLAKASPDALGGIELHASEEPALTELGLQSALGVMLTDKETQEPAGALLIGIASTRKWKPNESFFLQAVGDQLVLSVNHTRLRSLVRSLAVSDEKTGLLSRGAYLDCLLGEVNRSRPQNTPVSLVLLQVDRGGELLRQHGDSAVGRFVEQLARALSSAVRQTDIGVKYTAWSLVFVLPDTPLDSARALAEKLRQVAASVEPPWGTRDVTVSAVVAQASAHPNDESEDRVTEWINRAEAGLDEARQRGGNLLLPLATP